MIIIFLNSLLLIYYNKYTIQIIFILFGITLFFCYHRANLKITIFSIILIYCSYLLFSIALFLSYSLYDSNIL
jgi:hypothetical protein